jgi:hypothetical protein
MRSITRPRFLRSFDGYYTRADLLLPFYKPSHFVPSIQHVVHHAFRCLVFVAIRYPNS